MRITAALSCTGGTSRRLYCAAHALPPRARDARRARRRPRVGAGRRRDRHVVRRDADPSRTGSRWPARRPPPPAPDGADGPRLGRGRRRTSTERRTGSSASPIATLHDGGLQRAHLGPARVRQVDRHDHSRQRRRRGPRRRSGCSTGSPPSPRRSSTRRTTRASAWSGGSYGGGIQLVTAAIDCRVDAIVPIIAWHSLRHEPVQGRRPSKPGWSQPPLHRRRRARRSTRTSRPRTSRAGHRHDRARRRRPGSSTAGPGDARRRRSPRRRCSSRAPSTRSSRSTRRSPTTGSCARDGVPTAMLWFCGGHGACLDRRRRPGRDRRRDASPGSRGYVKRDASVDTGPRFDVHRPERRRVTRPPTARCAAGAPLRAAGTGHARADGRRAAPGPATAPRRRGEPDRAIVGADHARRGPPTRSNVKHHAPTPAPRRRRTRACTLTYSRHRAATATGRPRVFAQLVDDAQDSCVGNQITPIAVHARRQAAHAHACRSRSSRQQLARGAVAHAAARRDHRRLRPAAPRRARLVHARRGVVADRRRVSEAVHRGGSGPPLVCLHGFTDTWRTWELVLPALERAARRPRPDAARPRGRPAARGRR